MRELLDLENIDLNEVDSSFPCVEAGEHRVTIAEASFVAAKPESDHAQNLKVQFVLNSEAPQHGAPGHMVKPGFKLTRTFPVSASFLPDIKRLVEAALGTPGKLIEQIPQLAGRELFIRVTVRTTQEYGTQNDVKGFRSI